MALLTSGSYGQRARKLGHNWWELSWTVDTKAGRLRYPRGYTRQTDDKGAKRFIKKWGLSRRESQSGKELYW